MKHLRTYENINDVIKSYSDDYGKVSIYRDIQFGWWGNAWRLNFNYSVDSGFSNNYPETNKMSYYLDDIRDGIEHPDAEGYYSPEYSLGKTIEEVKKSIDDYYIWKEAKKYNL